MCFLAFYVICLKLYDMSQTPIARNVEEYLHYIDATPDAIFVLHEKLERRFPVHQHTKGQLTYVDGGLAYVHVQDKILVIPARHYIWIPPGLLHFLTVRSSATAIRTIYFTLDTTETFYQQMGIYPVDSLLLEMLLFTERFEWEVGKTNRYYPFLKALFNILPDISNNHLHTVLPVTRNERLVPILKYMEEHVSEVLSLSSISKAFSISERTLSRIFQSELSISFLQYLKQLRMVKAVEMMLQTELTLSEIAYRTGYQSIAAFSNTFYQLTNVRPSQFAQSIR
ncbi:AraC family transcriptional regulator [Pedobacter quisquiliarum]|uniref:AraC family transcriptional regulator n=2 Tax=Pedobacter quisquiliarum TaxID=1834438 RepID=A0A916U1P2_9SPHI|nr:AraC family transcriptional regulator [Pedobacter quisquiliarum]